MRTTIPGIEATLDRVLAQNFWLFGLAVTQGKYSAVHIPLIYEGSLRIQQEMYAAGLEEFSRWVGVAQDIESRLVDGVVFLFRSGTEEAVSSRALNLLTAGASFGTNCMKRIADLMQRLPAACLCTEEQWLTDEGVSPDSVENLHILLVQAVSVASINPFPETIIQAARQIIGDTPVMKDLSHRYIYAPSFSHLSYFAEELRHLEEAAAAGRADGADVTAFCWNSGFLADPRNEGCDYEQPDLTAQALGIPVPCPSFRAPHLRNRLIRLGHTPGRPPLCGDDHAVADNLLLRAFQLFRALQLFEEFRHYWQARAMRIFRCIAGEDVPLYRVGLAHLKGCSSAG